MSPTWSASAPEPAANVGSSHPWCESGAVTDELDFTFGKVKTVSDARARVLGVKWRHYVPTTVTNTSDKACNFTALILVNPDSKNEQLNDRVDIPLKPGQSAHLQLFNLKGETDTKDAAPEVDVKPRFSYGQKSPLLVNYYESKFKVAPGPKGKNAPLLTAELTVLAESPGMPGRSINKPSDTLTIVGLDAGGDIITFDEQTLTEPIGIGKTESFQLDDYGWGYTTPRQFTAGTYDDVVKWEIAQLAPVATEATPK